jgi:hypothetical protein
MIGLFGRPAGLPDYDPEGPRISSRNPSIRCPWVSHDYMPMIGKFRNRNRHAALFPGVRCRVRLAALQRPPRPVRVRGDRQISMRLTGTTEPLICLLSMQAAIKPSGSLEIAGPTAPQHAAALRGASRPAFIHAPEFLQSLPGNCHAARSSVLSPWRCEGAVRRNKHA